MIEMVGYIFGSLQSSENAIKGIRKTLRTQARFNKSVATLAVVMTAYIITVEACTFEQNRKIKQLESEIKELKSKKGD